VSSFWTARARDFITSQPGAWLRLMARKFVLLWNRTEMLDTESQESHAEWSWPLRLSGWFSHFGVVVPLALAGVILTWPDRRRLWVLYAMTGAYAFSVIIFFIYARYRYPLVPFLLLFSAVPLSEACELLLTRFTWLRPTLSGIEGSDGRRRVRELRHLAAPGLTTVALAAVFTNWPVLSPDLMKAITDHNVGAELQSRGRLDDATDHYRRAAAHKPDYAPAYNNLGTALAAKGDRAGAIEQYRRALAIQPGYDNAHYNLANALVADGEPDQAIEHFTRSLANSPPSADVYNNLGIALAESGRVDEAIDAMQTALRFDPNRPETHRNLARLYLNRGDFTSAAAAFREVVRLQPESAEAHNDLGVVLAAAGDPEGAIAEFERAVALQPGFVEAERNLAGARK
jgi:Flp pilus assembly protein TadD